MPQQQARQILEALVQGFDPSSGQPLPSGTVLQQAEVQRALLAGIAALEGGASRAARRQGLPGNVGRPWSSAEEQALREEFGAGTAPTEIAGRHGRTLAAIEARLERLGLLAPEQRTTRNHYLTHRPGSGPGRTT